MGDFEGEAIACHKSHRTRLRPRCLGAPGNLVVGGVGGGEVVYYMGSAWTMTDQTLIIIPHSNNHSSLILERGCLDNLYPLRYCTLMRQKAPQTENSHSTIDY